MKAQRGSRGTVPLSLNIRAIWRRSSRFSSGTEPRYPLEQRLGEPTAGLAVFLNTGLFISPSGISDPCGTVAGMVTPKGNMSTERQTLQVSVLPYRCSIC